MNFVADERGYGGHPKLSNKSIIVAMMSIHILIHVLAVPFLSALAATGRTDAPFYAGTGAMFVTLVAGYALTKAWGLTGVMIALISSGIVMLSVIYFFYRSLIVNNRGTDV